MEKTAQEIILEGYFAGYMEKKAAGTPTAGGAVKGNLGAYGNQLKKDEWDMWDNNRKKQFLANSANAIPKWMDEQTLKEFGPDVNVPRKQGVMANLFGW